MNISHIDPALMEPRVQGQVVETARKIQQPLSQRVTEAPTLGKDIREDLSKEGAATLRLGCEEDRKGTGKVFQEEGNAPAKALRADRAGQRELNEGQCGLEWSKGESGREAGWEDRKSQRKPGFLSRSNSFGKSEIKW